MLNKLMETRKISHNKKGFTLMEMLIVVAIIAILVAVSIPVFTTQLEKAREATDVANVRAAKAEAVAIYLTGDTATNVTWSATKDTFEANYDAANGVLITGTPTTPYGKGTSVDAKIDPDGATPHTGEWIHVAVDATGKVTTTWVNK